MRVKPRDIILTFKQTGSATETGEVLGIHRSTVYRWLKRAKKSYGYRVSYSSRSLSRKSTRPHTVHYALTSPDMVRVLKLRRERGYGARKVRYLAGVTVHHNTVHRLLGRHDLIKQGKLHRRPRFQDTVHMHAKNATDLGFLQMDVKHVTPELSGLPWTCYEYAVMDIYSRYKDAVILNQLDAHGAVVALLEVLSRLPFEAHFIQTDNGLEFLGLFRETVQKLGLKHHYIHKQSPNENAVIERSFRTDEEEFYFRMEQAPEHYDELRNWFKDYLWQYNYYRPHLSLQFKTPAEVVAEVVGQ